MTGFADLGVLGYEGMGQEITVDQSQLNQPPAAIMTPTSPVNINQISAATMTPLLSSPGFAVSAPKGTATGGGGTATGGGMMAGLVKYLPYLMLGAAAIFLLPKLMKKKNPCRTMRRRRRRM